MTAIGIEQFREMSRSRPDIRQRLQTAVGESEFAALAVKIASEEGYTFTTEDVLALTRARWRSCPTRNWKGSPAACCPGRRSARSGIGAVLEPGETLFMPPQYWHHVEYVETASSLTMRFGRNPYTRFLHTEMHRDFYRQNIAAKFFDAAAVEREHPDAWHGFQAACARAYESPREKYRAIRALFKKTYAQMCPDAIQGRLGSRRPRSSAPA